MKVVNPALSVKAVAIIVASLILAATAYVWITYRGQMALTREHLVLGMGDEFVIDGPAQHTLEGNDITTATSLDKSCSMKFSERDGLVNYAHLAVNVPLESLVILQNTIPSRRYTPEQTPLADRERLVFQRRLLDRFAENAMNFRRDGNDPQAWLTDAIARVHLHPDQDVRQDLGDCILILHDDESYGFLKLAVAAK